MLAARIAARLEAMPSLSEREASLRATNGKSPDMIRYIRTRNSMPSGDRLIRLAEVLETTPDYLLGRVAHPVVPSAPARRTVEPSAPTLQRDLPVFGTALGADLEFTSQDGEPVAIEQTMLNEAEVVDRIRRLPALQDERDAYALYTQGSSMEPLFEDGEPILVTPGRPVRPRDYVVVYLVRHDGNDGDEAAAVLVKRLVRRSGSYIELEQFNPPARFTVDAKRVAKIHRVMRWAEASGL